MAKEAKKELQLLLALIVLVVIINSVAAIFLLKENPSVGEIKPADVNPEKQQEKTEAVNLPNKIYEFISKPKKKTCTSFK